MYPSREEFVSPEAALYAVLVSFKNVCRYSSDLAVPRRGLERRIKLQRASRGTMNKRMRVNGRCSRKFTEFVARLCRRSVSHDFEHATRSEIRYRQHFHA